MNCPYHPPNPQGACPECSFDEPRLNRMESQAAHIVNGIENGDTPAARTVASQLRAIGSLIGDLVRYVRDSENQPITDEVKRMREVQKDEGAR